LIREGRAGHPGAGHSLIADGETIDDTAHREDRPAKLVTGRCPPLDRRSHGLGGLTSILLLFLFFFKLHLDLRPGREQGAVVHRREAGGDRDLGWGLPTSARRAELPEMLERSTGPARPVPGFWFKQRAGGSPRRLFRRALRRRGTGAGACSTSTDRAAFRLNPAAYRSRKIGRLMRAPAGGLVQPSPQWWACGANGRGKAKLPPPRRAGADRRFNPHRSPVEVGQARHHVKRSSAAGGGSDRGGPKLTAMCHHETDSQGGLLDPRSPPAVGVGNPRREVASVHAGFPGSEEASYVNREPSCPSRRPCPPGTWEPQHPQRERKRR